MAKFLRVEDFPRLGRGSFNCADDILRVLA